MNATLSPGAQRGAVNTTAARGAGGERRRACWRLRDAGDPNTSATLERPGRAALPVLRDGHARRSSAPPSARTTSDPSRSCEVGAQVGLRARRGRALGGADDLAARVAPAEADDAR